MDVISTELQGAVKFIIPYITFLNSHMVEFFTHNLWDKHIPSSIRDEFDLQLIKDKNVIELFNECRLNGDCSLNKLLKECNKYYPNPKNSLLVDIDTFLENLNESKNCFNPPPAAFNTFMSVKKKHEVELMSMVTYTLSKYTNAFHIVDIGDGKGYLSSNIALKYGLKVLGIDSCVSKTLGAAERLNKLKKQQPKFGKDSKSLVRSLGVYCDESSDYPQTITDETYKQVTMHITAETDIKNILEEHFPCENLYNFGVIGLHTCGNLSPACLNIFVNNNHYLKFLINVGCCYNHLEEDQGNLSTFPLSQYLRNQQFKLGRNARMLALQAPDRIYTTKKMCSSLMFRAVLEVFINKKFKDYNLTEKRVGRIGSKCITFHEYCLQGLSKLGLDTNVSETEAEEFYQQYAYLRPLLDFYFMLRVSFAPVIEYIILLDRLLYLHEHGLGNSYIVKLFDPCQSPRCFGIISFRDDQ